MSSAVSICSNALQLLGADAIASLTENTGRAKLCNSLYAPTRDRLLRSHPWTFARKRVLMNPTDEVPAFDWGKTYQLPDDMLRLIQVGLRGRMPRYEIEGRKLLTNEATLPLLYVFRNTDPLTYDAIFVDLLTASLCAQMAYPITKSASLADAKLKEFQLLRMQAGAVNGQEEDPEDLGSPTFVDVRG